MGMMSELHAAHQEAAIQGKDDHAYDLYLAETALERIAAGERFPESIARTALAEVRSTRAPRPARIVNGHVLFDNRTCKELHDGFRDCPVCVSGLSVCSVCGEVEAGLDQECKGSDPVEF